MTTKKEMREAADEIIVATRKYLEDGLATFKDDGEMEKMFRNDAAQLRLVIAWLREGNQAAALRTAQNLETAARDVIPDGPWEVLNR